jgi:hypothetical protein
MAAWPIRRVQKIGGTQSDQKLHFSRAFPPFRLFFSFESTSTQTSIE